MAADDGAVQTALTSIRAAPFNPAEHRLLSFFIKNSIDPRATALYLLKRTSHDAGNKDAAELELRSVLVDWKQIVRRFTVPSKLSSHLRALTLKRDSHRCRVTGKKSKWWDVLGWSSSVEPAEIIPPGVLEVISSQGHESPRQLLALFIGEDQLQLLIEALQAKSGVTKQLNNVWTLNSTAAAAFRNGQIQILPDWDCSDDTDEGNQSEYILGLVPPVPLPALTTQQGRRIFSDHEVLLSTTDPRLLPLPSSSLFAIHARFCNSVRSFHMDCQMRHRTSSGNEMLHQFKSAPQRLLHRAILFCRPLWLCLPQTFQVLFYRQLLLLGSRIHGGGRLAWLQPVPFSLYIKHGPKNIVPPTEPSAMKLIERHVTGFSSPRLIDIVTDNEHKYLIMTEVPGIPLSEAIHTMSYPERTQLAIDLRNFISRLRRIPNLNDQAICGADGGSVFDYRLPTKTKLAGPFASETEFNNFIVTQPRLRSATHARSHNIYFTHADLNPTNIMIDSGRLSGLVDFGCAGFYPEYWEYTKGVFGHFGPDSTWVNILSESFCGLYSEELIAEQKLWDVTPAW